MMEEQTVEKSMNSLYDYFCLAAGQHHVQIFHAPERIKFAEDCTAALNNYNRCVKRGREYTPRFTIANAPVQTFFGCLLVAITPCMTRLRVGLNLLIRLFLML